MAVTTDARPVSRAREVIDVVRAPLISPKFGPVMITALLLVTYVPAFSLTLPHLFGHH